MIREYPTPHEPYDGSVEDSPIVKLWYAILAEALKQHGERIHVAPGTAAGAYMVRLSRDGAWEEMITPPAPMYPAFMQRLKVMADLSLVNRIPLEEGVFRLRVGSLLYGLKVTKRIRPDDGLEEAMIELPNAPVQTVSSRD